jgi:hypothetical protein
LTVWNLFARFKTSWWAFQLPLLGWPYRLSLPLYPYRTYKKWPHADIIYRVNGQSVPGVHCSTGS